MQFKIPFEDLNIRQLAMERSRLQQRLDYYQYNQDAAHAANLRSRIRQVNNQMQKLYKSKDL
jgi:hypothetical protein